MICLRFDDRQLSIALEFGILLGYFPRESYAIHCSPLQQPEREPIAGYGTNYLDLPSLHRLCANEIVMLKGRGHSVDLSGCNSQSSRFLSPA